MKPTAPSGRRARAWRAPRGSRRAIIAGVAALGVLAPARAVRGADPPAWNALSSPALSIPGEDLTAVSCPARGSCVAAGTFVAPSGRRAALVVSLAGERLAASDLTVPAPSDPSLSPSIGGISCPSSETCVAVGTSSTFAGAPDTHRSEAATAFVATLRSRRWGTRAVPLLAGDAPLAATLSGVVCLSTDRCEAVGDETVARHDGARSQVAIVLVEHAGLWRARQAPLPEGAARLADAQLDAISCTPSGWCAAVGTYLVADGGQQGLLVSGSGTTWRAERAPRPPGGDAIDALGALTCGPSGGCVAAGTYDVGGTPEGLVLTRAGGAWHAAPGPDAATADAIYGVSGVTPWRVAVGTELDAVFDQHALVLTESPGGWRDAIAPIPDSLATEPGPGLGATLNAVSCASVTACLAVGTDVGASNHQAALALEYAGSAR